MSRYSAYTMGSRGGTKEIDLSHCTSMASAKREAKQWADRHAKRGTILVLNDESLAHGMVATLEYDDVTGMPGRWYNEPNVRASR